jgi:hypothetical protein
LHALIPKPITTVGLPHSLHTERDGSIPRPFPLLLLRCPQLIFRLLADLSAVNE